MCVLVDGEFEVKFIKVVIKVLIVILLNRFCVVIVLVIV